MGHSLIVGGENYGQGSSREHAALVPLYLGVRAVLAKSFARIHKDNLVNTGIVPLLFADGADFDALSLADTLETLDLVEAVRSGADRAAVRDVTTGREFTVRLELSARQREILLAGGLLNYTKEKAVH